MTAIAPAAGAGYGWVRFADGAWAVQAQPHVMIRLRRHFPRADASRQGVVQLRDTPEVARDLEWFLTRFPLEMDDITAAYLSASANGHRETEQAVRRILAGYRPPDGWREPARTPRGYQTEAAAIVDATGHLLVADDLGLGKTMTALLTLRNPEALPALVVAPAHLTAQWLKELQRTLPWLQGHIVTAREPYDLAGARGMGARQPDVVIISYAKLAGWAEHLAGQVRTTIFDEIQEVRRGSESAKGQAVYHVREAAVFRVGCSATPIHNYGDEAFHVIEAIAPGALGEKPEFLREWCGGQFGVAGHTLVRDPGALGAYLRDQGLMVARTRRDVHMQMPEPQLIEKEVDTNHATLDQVARDVAEQAEVLLGIREADPGDRWRLASEIDWRMRRATGLAKAAYVAEFVKLVLVSEKRVVLWGWHRDVYEQWLARLADYNPVLYTGTETPRQKALNAEAFCGGDSRVLIMSLVSGAGLDGLQEHCSVGVFGELDWSPAVHQQCIGRLDRPGQQSTVLAYFLTSMEGTDPLIAEVLGLKRAQAEPLRNPEAQVFAGVTADHERGRKIAADVLARLGRRGAAAAVR